MANSKTKAKSDEGNETLLKHVVDIQEKLNYIMSTVVEHAAEIKEQRKVLDQVRNRMGI